MVLKGYIQLGNAEPIGLANYPLIHLSNNRTIIGSVNAFDINNIINVLKSEHICFSIKSGVDLDVYPNLAKMQHWIVINNIINLTYQSCQKD